MTTSIRVTDWTKQQLDQIKDTEDHSSRDSVLKSLLKDREIAAHARTHLAEDDPHADWTAPAEKAVEGLLVLAEAGPTDHDEAHLWCPACGGYVMHLHIDDLRTITGLTIDCPRCGIEHDRHSLVALDINGETYPDDRLDDEDKRQHDLQTAVIDYWERALRTANFFESTGTGTVGEHLATAFYAHAHTYDWEWRPPDVPTTTLQTWHGDHPRSRVTYRNVRDDEYLILLESIRTTDDYRGLRYPVGSDPADADPELIPGDELDDLIEGKQLYRTYTGLYEVPDELWRPVYDADSLTIDDADADLLNAVNDIIDTLEAEQDAVTIEDIYRSTVMETNLAQNHVHIALLRMEQDGTLTLDDVEATDVDPLNI